MRVLISAFLAICLYFVGFSQTDFTEEDLCIKASEYFNTKKFELAMSAYRACIESDPSDAKTWYYLGNSAYNLKKYDDAIHAYNQAIDIDPDYHKARLHKGYTLLNNNQYKECIESLSVLIQRDSTQVKAYQFRGTAYMKSGMYLEAIADFDKSIIYSEPNYSNYLNRGICRVKVLDKVGALHDFKVASDIKPKEFTPIAERVKMQIELEMWPESIADATLAIAKKPSATDMFFCRGYAKLMMQDLNGADLDFNICLQLNPNHIHALKNKSITTMGMKKYEEAIMDLSNLIKHDSKNADLYLQRGNCFLASQHYENALIDYNCAIALKKDFGEAYFNRANIYSNLQNSKQACRDIKSAVEIGFEPANAYVVFLCK